MTRKDIEESKQYMLDFRYGMCKARNWDKEEVVEMLDHWLSEALHDRERCPCCNFEQHEFDPEFDKGYY